MNFSTVELLTKDGVVVTLTTDVPLDFGEAKVLAVRVESKEAHKARVLAAAELTRNVQRL